MTRVRVGEVELEVEEIGDGPPLVLIMGIGAQLIHWPDALCEDLAGRGFRVIRFDNRDIGLSTKLEHAGVPDIPKALVRAFVGLSVETPYTIRHMADDVAGLLDALDLEDAHVVGCSMGGMIAQTLAIEHPTRVRSLTSIMSTPGGRRHMGKAKAIRVLLGGPVRSAGEAEERALRVMRVIGSTGFAMDEERVRALARRAYERSYHPPGFARQFGAILAAGNRLSTLPSVRAPTLVIHGSEDPLIPPKAGRATAALVPGARLRMIEGMGHDLPAALWKTFADEIAGHARTSEGPRTAGGHVPQRGAGDVRAGDVLRPGDPVRAVG